MTQNDTTVTFTRDELVEEIEAGARRAVGLSAAEFVKALRDNTIAHNRSSVVDLVVLVNLLPEDDPLFATV
jgi:hypothetical protein